MGRTNFIDFPAPLMKRTCKLWITEIMYGHKTKIRPNHKQSTENSYLTFHWQLMTQASMSTGFKD